MSDERASKTTVIEEGTGFKGDFDSDCPIVVKGRIEGHMKAPSLTVDATGSVSGTVKVKELRSEGIISGEYDADYVKLSGTVKDNTIIRARTLEVALTPQRGRMQVTFGECELDVGEVANKADAIARAETDGHPPAAVFTSSNLEAPLANEGSVDAQTDALLAAELDAGNDEPKRHRNKDRRHNSSLPPAR
jgi:hypothetical protein